MSVYTKFKAHKLVKTPDGKKVTEDTPTVRFGGLGRPNIIWNIKECQYYTEDGKPAPDDLVVSCGLPTAESIKQEKLRLRKILIDKAADDDSVDITAGLKNIDAMVRPKGMTPLSLDAIRAGKVKLLSEDRKVAERILRE